VPLDFPTHAPYFPELDKPLNHATFTPSNRLFPGAPGVHWKRNGAPLVSAPIGPHPRRERGGLSAVDPPLHPLIRRAAEGRLPEWARAGKARRAHMQRVSDLLRGWALASGCPERDVVRWAALGYLHDVVREAPPEQLRGVVPPAFRDLPGSILHGPAGAVRLREEGVDDPEFLHAVAFHTLGHPDLGPAGRALYAADFLEPGRKLRPRWRAALRKRMPGELDQVLQEILGARLKHLLARKSGIRAETLLFWNSLVESRG